jgi:hypothetical protein
VRVAKDVTFVAAVIIVVAIAAPAGFAPSRPSNAPFGPASATTTTPHASEPAGPGAPRAGGYFQTLPPGSPLPTGAQCAARVRRSAWEPRPQNTTANHTVVPQPVTLPDNPAFDARWQQEYKPRINGDFVGTTDEIIQWASCKWGIADDLTRARAVQESSWKQSTVSDFEPRSSGHCAKDQSTTSECPTSFGLLQSKWYFRPGVYPDTKISTAFNVDSVLAETRGCLDGLAWVGPRSKGDVWGCIGLWYSGEWGQNDASYVASVREIFAAKPWLSWTG